MEVISNTGILYPIQILVQSLVFILLKTAFYLIFLHREEYNIGTAISGKLRTFYNVE